MNIDNAPPLALKLASGIAADRLLSSNLAALSACDLDLAKRVAATKLGTDEIVVRPAASGWPTVQIGQAGGLLIHSAVDPIAEAEAQAARVPIGASRAMALGFGAGHLLAVMLQRQPLLRLDVAAMSPKVLRAVASACDLKPLLCNSRLRFLADDKAGLPEAFVAVPPLLRLAEPARIDLRDAALDVLAAEALRLRMDRQRPRWQGNLLANQSIYLADPGVATLGGKHTGAVVVIVAAGPSLTAQLPVLAKVFSPRSPGRARPGAPVLIALTEALGLLGLHGVVPDYVVAVDGPGELPPALRGPASPIGLIYVPVIDRRMVESWTGKRYVAGLVGCELLAPIGRSHPGSELSSDGSELLLTIDLGRRLGAAALVLVGADLCTQETAAQDQAGLAPPRQVAGVSGKPVSASAAQIACRHNLESYLTQIAAPGQPALKIYNTSALGARIAGTSEQTLADVLGRLKVLEANPHA